MVSIQFVEGVAVGGVVMAFMPSVARKIKATFVHETQAVKTDVKADASKAVADVTKKL